MNILHIDSSARMAESASRRLSAEIVTRLMVKHPGATVAHRDLAADPIPHIDEAFTRALLAETDACAAPRLAALARSERLIAEVERAAAIVIGAPMYNYGVPSTLKAWIDHVVRPRRTFRHTPTGPVGVLRDRPVWIAVASGGIYTGGAGVKVDFLVPYLRTVLGKIGLHSVECVAAEGGALEPEEGAAFANAITRLDSILPRAEL